MTKTLRLSILLALTAPVAACGSTPAPTDAGSAMSDTGPMSMTDARMRPDAGPTNDSFEGAETITTDGTAAMDAIEAPEDVDFFRFEGTAGQWVSINTTANPDDDPELVDTVVTLYDSTRTQIAENDDRIPRGDTDSEIVIQLPDTGTYYVEVQEFSTWMPAEPPAPEGRSAYTYELAVTTLTTGGALFIDAEPGDDAATATNIMFGGMSSNLAFVMGGFSDASDVDVYRFTVPAAAGGLLSVDIMPHGPDGYGSTRASGNVRVTDMAGTDVLARVEPRGMTQLDFSPTLVPGSEYLLWVDAGGGTAGSNDHYVLKVFVGTENPPENETVVGSNDSTAMATALTTEDDMGVLRAFVLGTLPSGDTADVFSVDVPAGRQLNVFCGSQSVGSGLRGMSLAVLGPDGTTVLGMDTETATEGAAVEDVMVAAAGTHYVRVRPGTMDATVRGDFYRCGIALVTPMAP
jgi:hypothetical protein